MDVRITMSLSPRISCRVGCVWWSKQYKQCHTARPETTGAIANLDLVLFAQFLMEVPPAEIEMLLWYNPRARFRRLQRNPVNAALPAALIDPSMAVCRSKFPPSAMSALSTSQQLPTPEVQPVG